MAQEVREAAAQAWWPEVNPQNPYGGRKREPTLQSPPDSRHTGYVNAPILNLHNTLKNKINLKLMAPQYVASFPLIECQCGARLGVSYTVPKPLHLQLPDLSSSEWK